MDSYKSGLDIISTRRPIKVECPGLGESGVLFKLRPPTRADLHRFREGVREIDRAESADAERVPVLATEVPDAASAKEDREESFLLVWSEFLCSVLVGEMEEDVAMELLLLPDAAPLKSALMRLVAIVNEGWEAPVVGAPLNGDTPPPSADGEEGADFTESVAQK